jgi:hypothetical protein
MLYLIYSVTYSIRIKCVVCEALSLFFSIAITFKSNFQTTHLKTNAGFCVNCSFILQFKLLILAHMKVDCSEIKQLGYSSKLLGLLRFQLNLSYALF